MAKIINKINFILYFLKLVVIDSSWRVLFNCLETWVIEF